MVNADLPSSKPFRIIIVGAGIVGLTLSHSFQLANIDHVVLEKHAEIVSVSGGAIIFWPSVARILDQFGILPEMMETAVTATNEYQRREDGSVQYTGSTMNSMTTAFAVPPFLTDRPRFVKDLYKYLPDKSRVQLSKRVANIEHTDTGVRVTLSDGSVEEGDMVIGADGVHSVVKNTMWDFAGEFEPDVIPESDKTAFSSELSCLFGTSEFKDDSFGLGPADNHVISGPNTAKLLFTHSRKIMWAVSFKDQDGLVPKDRKATEEDMEVLAKHFANIKFTEKVKLSDLWETRQRYGALNIEEGVISRWHAGRIVLVGDSAHKMTSDLGMGANLAIESAVSLCNIIHRELKTNPHRHFPRSELSAIFAEYQKDRYGRVKAYVDLAGKVTRMNSLQTRFDRFFVNWISPLLEDIQKQKFIESIAQAPKLSYLPQHTVDESADGWKLGEKLLREQRERTGKQNKPGSTWLTYALLTSTIGVGLDYLARERLLTFF